jgi:hypothetical protein
MSHGCEMVSSRQQGGGGVTEYMDLKYQLRPVYNYVFLYPMSFPTCDLSF